VPGDRRGLRAWLADLLLGREGPPPEPKPKRPRAVRKLTRLGDDLDRLRDRHGDPREGPRGGR
jgi:hypothetical protein